MQKNHRRKCEDTYPLNKSTIDTSLFQRIGHQTKKKVLHLKIYFGVVIKNYRCLEGAEEARRRFIY